MVERMVEIVERIVEMVKVVENGINSRNEVKW